MKTLDERKDYKKIANNKMIIEKELEKDNFDVKDFLDNRHMLKEILNMDSANPNEVLQWNCSKAKIMRDIHPNIILQNNNKKKNKKK